MEVRRRVGARTRRARPSQKSEKTKAAPRARRTVETVNVRKMMRGVREKRRWVKMKDWRGGLVGGS